MASQDRLIYFVHSNLISRYDHKSSTPCTLCQDNMDYTMSALQFIIREISKHKEI